MSMSDNPTPNLSRSERLFDDLISKDSSVLPNSFAVKSHDDQNKKAKIDEEIENIECKTTINVVKKENSDLSHISAYKGLLQEIDNRVSISELCAGLLNESNFALRCQSALSLAVYCRSQQSDEDCKAIIEALHAISDCHEFYAFSFCQALLLYVLTKQNLNSEQFLALENCILKVSYSVIRHKEILEDVFAEARIVLLGGERYLTACKLCKEMFPEENFDINSLDVSTICCASLRSLSKIKVVSTGHSKFSDNTLKYVISMIGKSTQEIISENLIDFDDETEISVSSYTVNQCLQVLEQILSVDPASPCKTLDHEDYSLMRCLTKLLEWSISSLFPHETSENYLFKVQNALHAFYLSTLISILKVFSILSFDHDQYEYYTNAKGTIEKIMVCILKIYFQSEGNHFDVLVLALELLINFSFACKKAFALVCLKKFQINVSENVSAIEALIKILDFNLQKINEIKAQATSLTSNEASSENGVSEEPSDEIDIDLVLKAADEDMELSTIVSFIGILLMIFIDTKKSFLDFIQERITPERCKDAVIVSQKFLQFTLITGGMPATGILLLRASIKKLNQLHQSS